MFDWHCDLTNDQHFWRSSRPRQRIRPRIRAGPAWVHSMGWDDQVLSPEYKVETQECATSALFIGLRSTPSARALVEVEGSPWRQRLYECSSWREVITEAAAGKCSPWLSLLNLSSASCLPKRTSQENQYFCSAGGQFRCRHVQGRNSLNCIAQRYKKRQSTAVRTAIEHATVTSRQTMMWLIPSDPFHLT